MDKFSLKILEHKVLYDKVDENYLNDCLVNTDPDSYTWTQRHRILKAWTKYEKKPWCIGKKYVLLKALRKAFGQV